MGEEERKSKRKKTHGPASSQANDILPKPPTSLFCCWAWHCTARNTSLVSLDNLPGSIFPQPPVHPQSIYCEGQNEKQRRPLHGANTVQQQLQHDCYQHHFGQNLNQHRSSCYKFTPSQPDPVHRPIPACRRSVIQIMELYFYKPHLSARNVGIHFREFPWSWDTSKTAEEIKRGCN